MAFHYSPKIVTDGLIINLDAANPKSYSQNVGTLLNGLVSYWNLDGNSNDIIGTNNGTDVNVNYVSGKIEQGVNFSGNSSSYVVLGSDIPSINSASEFTVSCWVKFKSIENLQRIISKWNYGSQGSFAVTQASLGVQQGLYFFICGTLGDAGGNVTFTNFVFSTGVYYICCVFDGTQPTEITRAKIYINGVDQTHGYIGTINTTTTSGNDPIRLGIYNGDTNYPANNITDEVGIWDRALTQTEVTTLYNITNSLNKWKDLSSNGNDGLFTKYYGYSQDNNGSIITSGATKSGTINYTPGIIDGPRTYSIWVKYNTISGLNAGFALTGIQEINAYNYVGIMEGGYFYTYIGGSGTLPGRGDIQSCILSPNIWYNQTVVLFQDGSRKAYLDGVEVGSYTGTLGVASTEPFWIGSLYAQHYLNGNISMILQYNRSLTQTEITQNYNALRTRYNL